MQKLRLIAFFSAATAVSGGLFLLPGFSAAQSPSPAKVAAPAAPEVSKTRTVRAWTFQSEKHQVALLELYTSQECNSCPPAEKFLNSLKAEKLDFDRVCPLAFHVSYWPHLGWTDSFTRPEFNERHKLMAESREHNQPYTPQLFLNGADTKLRDEKLLEALEECSSRPAAFKLGIQVEMAMNKRSIEILAQATKFRAGILASEAAVAQFAIIEMGLETKVEAGENKGHTLVQNFVVRRLLDDVDIRPDDGVVPIGFPHEPLAKDWNPDKLGVVGWIRLRKDSRVVQAAGGLLESATAKTIQVPE